MNQQENPIKPENAIGHDLSAAERDTYEVVDRSQKEQLSAQDVKEHWIARAKREGVQAVMSARHTVEENERATAELQKEILEFISGLFEDKRVFEFGVGVGRMTAVLAEKAKEVLGIDMTPEMIEKAKKNLENLKNIQLLVGKITEADLPAGNYDLVFESIVLLHITNPQELKETVEKLKTLSGRIFIVEHTFDPQNPDLPSSKFSIFRKPEEYAELFKPYQMVKQKDTRCAGDRFTMMLFEKV
jgi:2-polyprenyl-3-methyl-5-hydroxy-6-metoxy-1,4-benzoquinol methylase